MKFVLACMFICASMGVFAEDAPATPAKEAPAKEEAKAEKTLPDLKKLHVVKNCDGFKKNDDGTVDISFEKGKVYVVEAWADWCGPCIAVIPHVNKLSQEYKDVSFIGFSLSRSLQHAKKVAERPDMTYNVVHPANPADFRKVFMDGCKVRGIPHAFLIKDGKIVWHDHPANLDKALKKYTK